ncbi:MAG: L-aspartate dehydrogenase [Candidatus Alkanophagales archaeon MCA70_species_2]|nr:L-aspartate dehydrogenase [Candidatus Alkanophaga liquidiphilum]
MRVGIIGCGAIGTEISRAVDEDRRMELVFLVDRHPERVEKLCSMLRKKPKFIKFSGEGFEELLPHIDLLVECASQSAVCEFVLPALRAGKDVLILSVGALVDAELLEEVERHAKEKNCRVYIPSGAVVGIDGLKSGGIGKIHSVRLRTRKPPCGFEGNKHVNFEELNEASEPKVLFRGSAKEAVRLFPENVNVAASLSLAGIGVEKTEVEVVADPTIDKNIHEVEVRGEFGRFVTLVENVPSPSNPKTSYLAALSAIATLKGIVSNVRVGT